MIQNKIMFGFLENMFIGLLSTCTVQIFNGSLAFNSKGPVKCVSLNNRPCQARPTFVIINSNETLFYPFTADVNNCGGVCNITADPYARMAVPNKVKSMNIKYLI